MVCANNTAAITGMAIGQKLLLMLSSPCLYGFLSHVDTNVHNLHLLMIDWDGSVRAQTMETPYQELKLKNFPTLIHIPPDDNSTPTVLRSETYRHHNI